MPGRSGSSRPINPSKVGARLKSVVWLFDRDTVPDSCRRAPGQHQHRMGDFKKSTVIPAGVEASDVEVPTSAGQNQEIGLD